MAYTTIAKPNTYFNTVTYAGTGSSQSISVGFRPDLNWIKDRSIPNSHGWFDSVRNAGGTPYELRSNATDAQSNFTGYYGSIDSTGFTVINGGDVNNNGNTYVSWNWLANGAGSSNTDGDVTATVSANQTSGFSIVKYVNPASGSPFTVGHGLGSAPKMIIIKNTSGVQNWGVWHTSIGFGNYLILNTTAANGAANLVTATSSTTFSTYQDHHSTGVDLIAYCFAEKKGFSKFGSYTGNGSTDGPFIYTGFKPAFIITKKTSATSPWHIYDNQRANPFNVVSGKLVANTAEAEAVGAECDFLSNGVKIRASGSDLNGSGAGFIYMAFAENPIVTTDGLPATAR